MKPFRILIADDHAVVRRGLRALLEAQPGWDVCEEAANGHEAVEKAVRIRPDLIIMDISMPELNGLEATRRIVSTLPGSQVLILTMHDSPELIERVVAAGARGYVLKSDAERDLRDAIEAVCHGKPFFTPSAAEVMLTISRVAAGRPRSSTASRHLTTREHQVVQLLAEGKGNKQVAAALNVSVRTVESHRARVMRKLALKSFSDLVRYAIRHKMVTP